MLLTKDNICFIVRFTAKYLAFVLLVSFLDVLTGGSSKGSEILKHSVVFSLITNPILFFIALCYGFLVHRS